jgi:hypothetical protein
MNAILLKILDVFSFLYRMMGVNYQQLRAIVDIKLTMDNRRQIVSYRMKGNQETSNSFMWTLIFYCIFGGFVAIALYGIPSFILSMIMFFSYIMVMVCMTLITDFSSILLDTSDNTIILPRPVDGRTVFAARLTHIFLYLGQITIGLAILPSVIVLIKYGVVMLIFFMMATVLTVIAGVVFTNIFYLLILRFTSEEKLRNVINYFQIFMAVFIMGGYQLVPRMAKQIDFLHYNFEITWLSFFVPPVWMGAALESWYLRSLDAEHLLLTVLAVIVPLLGFYMVNRYLTPVFTRKLGVIAVESKSKPVRKQNKNFIATLSSIFTSSASEQGGFELIWHMLGRDRKIKLKIYPVFGFVIIFGIVFLFQGKQDFATTWNNLGETQYHLLLVYLSFMILQVAIYEIPYSDDFRASWVYSSAPVEKPGDILTGTLKALIARLFIPGYIAVSTFILFVWGLTALDDILFGFLNNFIMVFTIVLVNKRSFPLSLAPNLRNQAGNFMRSMLMFILVGVLGLTHYLLSRNAIWILAATPVQVVAIAILYARYKKTNWDQLTL